MLDDITLDATIPPDEEDALAWLQDNTVLSSVSGTIADLKATFPASIPPVIVNEDYKINSRFTLAAVLPAGATIEIKRDGNVEVSGWQPTTVGPFWYTDLIPGATPADFDGGYGGAVENYVITITGPTDNPLDFNTTVLVESVISKDGFGSGSTLTVLDDITLGVPVPADEAAALAWLQANTTLEGDLDLLTATFPPSIPPVIVAEPYKINSRFTLANVLPTGTKIDIYRDGNLEVNDWSPTTLGPFWYTDLIPGATPADFDGGYGGAVEEYTIVITGPACNPLDFTTTVLIESVIDKDGFGTGTETVLASTTEDVSIPSNTSALSGAVTYYNLANTVMNNVKVDLQQGGASVLWTTTDASGQYSFANVCQGTYDVVLTTVKPAGSINSTDAAQVNYYPTAPYWIEKARFYAGDVASSMTTLNSTDALRIQQYFVFGTPFDRAPWTFWKAGDLINFAGPTGDGLYPTITIGASSQTVNFYGMSTGDFNQSFTPGGLKSAPLTLGLIYDQVRQVGANQEFELPLRLVNASGVGAISLIMNFPDELVQISDVIVPANSGHLDWTVYGNELRIGWNSQQPLFLTDDASLVILKMRTTGEFVQGNAIELNLISDPLNELADESYNVISGALLRTDIIQASTVGIDEKPVTDNLVLTNYPNPFDDYTMIKYSLPFSGKITLEIYGTLGNTLVVLVDEEQATGEYTVRYSTAGLATGIYTAIIRLESGDKVMTRSIKMMNHSNRY